MTKCHIRGLENDKPRITDKTWSLDTNNSDNHLTIEERKNNQQKQVNVPNCRHSRIRIPIRPTQSIEPEPHVSTRKLRAELERR